MTVKIINIYGTRRRRERRNDNHDEYDDDDDDEYDNNLINDSDYVAEELMRFAWKIVRERLIAREGQWRLCGL